MGIGGHMLGPTKLARLRRVSGLNLDRAFRRGRQCEGRVIWGDWCLHYEIDWATGEHRRFNPTNHWVSCPQRGTT